MVRYKVVPPAEGVETLFAVRDALPLVPGSVEDCCTRIRNRTTIPSRDAAREWLTFCQALGLAAETGRGYHRLREDPDREALARRFRENVFPARELLGVLETAAEPIGAEAAFEHLADEVPRWERNRSATWAEDWRERTGRLLDWGVRFGVIRAEDGGYVLD